MIKKQKSKRECCCNDADVAEAIGLKLYAKSRSDMRRNQLMTIKSLVTVSEFPAKRKHGKRLLYHWDEVAAWAAQNLVLADNKRAFTFNLATPPTAVQALQPDESERERILARYPSDYRTRLTGLYDKWLKPNNKDNKSLTKSEKDELLATGLVREIKLPALGVATAAPFEIPDYCSQSEFARLMSELYNAFVSPQMISVAISKEGMPGKMTNGSLKTSLAAPWWEENKVRKVADAQGNLFAKAQAADAERKIDEARRARLEANELERSTSNKWIELALVENFMEGRGLRDCDATDRLIEDKTGLRKTIMEQLAAWLNSKLKTHNLELPEFDAILAEEFRKANDALKKQFLANLTDLNQKITETSETKG